MTAGPGTRARVRRVLPWVAVVVGVALVVVVAGRGEEEGNPLDPASPGPLGTKGLVEVLRELGGEVRVSGEPPGAGTETALLLSDDLTPGRRQGLLDWVRRGGTLVVADPSSGVTAVEQAGSTRIGLLDAEIERRCDVAALADVGRVAAPGGIVFEIPEGQAGSPERRRPRPASPATTAPGCWSSRSAAAPWSASAGPACWSTGSWARPTTPCCWPACSSRPRGPPSRCSSRPCPAGATPG